MYINSLFEDPMTVVLEQYVGNACVQRQKLTMPPYFLEAQFKQMMNQIARQSQPMKVKMIRFEEIWDEFEKRRKTIENFIEFQNWRDEK